MALFSRSFIRKRIISAATTFVLTAASLALGQNPPAVHRVHPATMARPATAPQMPAEMPVLHASGLTNRTEWGAGADLRLACPHLRGDGDITAIAAFRMKPDGQPAL